MRDVMPCVSLAADRPRYLSLVTPDFAPSYPPIFLDTSHIHTNVLASVIRLDSPSLDCKRLVGPHALPRVHPEHQPQPAAGPTLAPNHGISSEQAPTSAQ